MKQLNIWLMALGVMLASMALANAAGDVDLEATMKKMNFAVSQAAKAETKAEFKTHIASLSELVAQAKEYSFPPERKQESLEGLNKVATVIETINSEVDSQDLDQVKSHLRNIDGLRKEYHKKNKPSFWQSIFG